MGLIDLRTADSDGYIYPSVVPLMSKYKEKELYKMIGAISDKATSLWLIAGGHVNPLNMPPDTYKYLPNVLADGFYYAESSQRCWKCSESTLVYCIALRYSAEVETNNSLDDNLIIDICYQFYTNWTTLTNCIAFDDETEREIKNNIPMYYIDYSKTKNEYCYMNHCEHCGTKLGDFYMHSEPGGAFFPMSIQEGEQISLIPVHRKILAQAGIVWNSASYIAYASESPPIG